MSVAVQSTQEITKQFLAMLEARLNQTTPAADRAFNNVIAADSGLAFTALAKFAVDRTLAAYAYTAKGADLDALGREYDAPRHPATSWQGTLTLTGTNGTVIPVSTILISPATGRLYTVTGGGTIALGTVTLAASAQGAGVAGNLSNGAQLALQSSIVGATGIPTVASTTVTGAEAESDDYYRVRVLDAQQSTPTGSNATSYRLWAQSVAGVIRAYPYAGSPTGSGITPEPPMRTVYVECDAGIQVDGIAPAGLLSQVRTAITTDAATALVRQDLGLTDGTLYVQAITRTSIYVQISSLNVPSGQTAQCQAAILSALTTYLLAVTPFISGVDPSFTRNDSITNPSVSDIIQGVLVAYGASAVNIAFGLTGGTFQSSYTVGQGEKAKLGGVAYV
jgi:hypothetical protein